MQSISIYIHIPFCKKKCRYCDFYSVPYEKGLADDFIKALVLEWDIVKKQFALSHTTIKSVFFGGGTPSLLSYEQWEALHKTFLRELHTTDKTEWTIECNPDSFSIEKAQFWKTMGISRLTFGIQSLDNKELCLLGRPHNAATAESVLYNPILKQFKSVGADVMFGLPGQTPESFENSLTGILRNPVITHISAYELAVNRDTSFGRHKSILPLPGEDNIVDMTQKLIDTCAAQGFFPYEISNFAKPGFECIHNLSYWDHSPYIGLGPAAHSYIHPNRFSNKKNVFEYISLLIKGERPIDMIETLSQNDICNELIFLRLRTSRGLNEIDFYQKTGRQFNDEKRKAVLEELLQEEYIYKINVTWKLSNKGMMVADAIIKRLA